MHNLKVKVLVGPHWSHYACDSCYDCDCVVPHPSTNLVEPRPCNRCFNSECCVCLSNCLVATTHSLTFLCSTFFSFLSQHGLAFVHRCVVHATAWTQRKSQCLGEITWRKRPVQFFFLTKIRSGLWPLTWPVFLSWWPIRPQTRPFASFLQPARLLVTLL